MSKLAPSPTFKTAQSFTQPGAHNPQVPTSPGLHTILSCTQCTTRIIPLQEQQARLALYDMLQISREYVFALKCPPTRLIRSNPCRTSPTGLSAATSIGRYVTVGQGCMLRSTTIEHESVIGDKCVLMEGSLVESHCVLAPGTVVTPGRLIPYGQLWAGNPARFVRDLTSDEVSPHFIQEKFLVLLQ